MISPPLPTYHSESLTLNPLQISDYGRSIFCALAVNDWVNDLAFWQYKIWTLEFVQLSAFIVRKCGMSFYEEIRHKWAYQHLLLYQVSVCLPIKHAHKKSSKLARDLAQIMLHKYCIGDPLMLQVFLYFFLVFLRMI